MTVGDPRASAENPYLTTLAAEQAGAISRRQARSAGMSDGAIRARLRYGHWQTIWPGIYATFTGPPPRQTLLWAAILHCGQDALLSHETAAEIWGFTDTVSTSLHVTVKPTCQITSRPGLIIHHASHLDQARHPSRLPPLTRVEATAIDLTQTAASIDQAFGWLSSACEHRLTTTDKLRDTVRQRGRLRWRAEIVDALSDVRAGCHSVLERRYMRIVEQAHELPMASRQFRSKIDGRTQYDDNRHEQWKLVIELDGQVAHAGRARDRDRSRDNRTVASGVAVLRYGWRDITQQPCRVAAQVATVLRRNGWEGLPARCSPNCTVLDTQDRV